MNMEKNTPIVVRPVGNGWIVMPAQSMAAQECISDSETLVFQTIEALQVWLAWHFAREVAA